MRRRFELRDGLLVDRDGHVLGRLVSVTIAEVDGSLLSEEKGGTTGGDEETSSTADCSSDVVGDPKKQDGGVGEGPSDVDRVWATYVLVMEPRRKELDPDSRKIIREALKVASVAECDTAIRGCKASAFHMGQNDRQRKYNKLSQILKGKRGGRSTREQIDFFVEIADANGVTTAGVAVDGAKLSRCKQAVMTAWEFPADDLAAAAGAEARLWLAENDIEVIAGPKGRPFFMFTAKS